MSDSQLNYPPRPNSRLDGRVAIVAGAGSQANSGLGNGRAAAILLAEAGCSVVCADFNLGWAQTTVDMITREFGHSSSSEGQLEGTSAPRAVAIQMDPEDCKRTVDLALETFGRLDILVNNVGIGGTSGTAVDVDVDEWKRGMDINVLGMVLMMKYAVPAMERNEVNVAAGSGEVEGGRGAIVNMASVAGLVGGNPMFLYPTSKGAILNMTRAMAAHHAKSGIRVNCVCPGMLYTPMMYSEGMSDEVREARRKGALLETEGNAWDAGLAVRFLASDESRWITGIALTVDAGFTAAPPSALTTTGIVAKAKL